MNEPLNALRRGDATWSWSDACESAFTAIKTAIVNFTALTIPDFSEPFQIFCDASEVGIGAAMIQGSVLHPRVIAFASRSLSGAERAYSTTEKEILAVLWSLERWRYYTKFTQVSYSTTEKEILAVLWSLERWRYYTEFTQVSVYTDHQALAWLCQNSAVKSRIARWILRLQNFRFEIAYRPAKNQVLPDAFSRAPVDAAPILWIQCDRCDKWFHYLCMGSRRLCTQHS